MNLKRWTLLFLLLLSIGAGILLGACSETAKLPLSAGIGPTPTLPEPRPALIPTVRIAKAIGWPAGRTPTTIAGTKVNAFAGQLDHPRWLAVLPNGDVLVAETNAPPRPGDGGGLKGWIAGLAMQRAGATVPSADRITLLRDVDGDGVAELRSVFVSGLTSPFGMALIGERFFVANTDGVVVFPYVEGMTRIEVPATRLTELPAGPINHHWTKSLIASTDGSTLFATVGSNSNAAENGIEQEKGRAAIWTIDPVSGDKRLFATGLRNPNGMAFEPSSGKLWTAVNERDEIGSDLVPDYMTQVREGGYYGWPYSYYGQHVDGRALPARPDLVAKAIAPDFALGAHTASLGLTWSGSQSLPDALRRGMFVGQHGSWNRNPPSGYRVIFVPFADGKPVDAVVEVLTGFRSEDGEAYGRPVGVAMDSSGALLVADDVGNVIWRVSAK